MRKIVFALSVVLTVMTACEDNNEGYSVNVPRKYNGI